MLKEGLKQRMIGALVLLVLLIVLAPALLQGGKTHPLVIHSSKPLESPPVPDFVKQLEVTPDNVTVTPPAESQSELTGAAGVDGNGYLKAWTLQLATFADLNNTRRLVKQLRAEGYSAYQKTVTGNNGQRLYRVNIGPEVRPNELEKIQKDLKQSMGLEGIVVSFVP